MTLPLLLLDFVRAAYALVCRCVLTCILSTPLVFFRTSFDVNMVIGLFNLVAFFVCFTGLCMIGRLYAVWVGGCLGCVDVLYLTLRPGFQYTLFRSVLFITD
jgi:hypothetical protein